MSVPNRVQSGTGRLSSLTLTHTDRVTSSTVTTLAPMHGQAKVLWLDFRARQYVSMSNVDDIMEVCEMPVPRTWEA